MQKSICKNSLWHSQNKYRLTMDSEQFIQSLLINIGIVITLIMKSDLRDFPGGTVVKNPPAKKKKKRIRLPMQGTQVPSLVREYPTCRGATKPLCLRA